MKKPRSPNQIAKTRKEKKTYSFSLIKANADQIAELASRENIPVSELVDEAISYYLETLKEINQK